VAPAERLGFGRCSARLPLGPFRRPRASAGQLCGGHRSGESPPKNGRYAERRFRPRDVAGQVVGPRAEAEFRRGREVGSLHPGAMFPPDCVANRLCSRVAEEVNSQEQFAGGGEGGECVAQQARLAKHVEKELRILRTSA
jgi:hypothetical protein